MTVKLSSLKADLDREQKGDWIEYPEWPGVAFNVSSLFTPEYVVARDLLVQKLTRKHKGAPPPPNELTPAIGKLYAKHILHGWRGLDVDYSPDKALETLTNPEFRNVTAAVEWCAGQLAQINVEFIEDAAKNSDRPSAGD